jgi:hypothetical protein
MGMISDSTRRLMVLKNRGCGACSESEGMMGKQVRQSIEDMRPEQRMALAI